MRKPILDYMVQRVERLTDFFINTEHSNIRLMMPYILPIGQKLMKNNLITFLFGLDHEIGV
jgi:hypothetical protein